MKGKLFFYNGISNIELEIYHNTWYPELISDIEMFFYMDEISKERFELIEDDINQYWFNYCRVTPTQRVINQIRQVISFIKEADKKRNVMWYAQSASPATKHSKFAKLAKKAGVKETFIPKFLLQYSICNYAEFIKNSTSPVTLYSEFHTAKLKNNLG